MAWAATVVLYVAAWQVWTLDEDPNWVLNAAISVHWAVFTGELVVNRIEVLDVSHWSGGVIYEF